MRTEVLRRHMPPWAAVPGYGEFANDNGLTPRETQFLVSWVEGLGPRNGGTTFLNVPAGVPAPAPVRASARAGGWQLGEPDLARRLESITIPPSAGLVVRHATIDLATDRTRAHRRSSSSCPAIAAACARPRSAWNPRGSGWAVGRRGTASRSCRRAWPSSSPQARACRWSSTTAPVPIRSPTSAHSGSFWLGGASVPPADLVVTAPGTAGRSGVRRGSVRLASDATIWAVAPEIPPGTGVPGAVRAASRRLDRGPAARGAADRRLADALRVQVAGSTGARDRASLRARDRRPLDGARTPRHQPLRSSFSAVLFPISTYRQPTTDHRSSACPGRSRRGTSRAGPPRRRCSCRRRGCACCP